MSLNITPNVTNFSKTGDTPLSGYVTVAGTANQVILTQTGQEIVFSLPQSIATSSSPTFAGLTLSAMTLGSVLFAGVGGAITQDNANIFFDNTNKFLRIKQLKFISQTATSAFAFIDIPNSVTLTLDLTGTNAVMNFNPTVIFEQANTVYAGLYMAPNLKNPPGEANNFGTVLGVYDNSQITADTQAVTCTTYISLSAAPVFNRINSGTLALTAGYGLFIAPEIATGVTATQWVGIGIQDALGAGSITTQIGIDVFDLTRATTNIALRTQGSTQSRLGGKVYFGGDVAPTGWIDVSLGGTRTWSSGVELSFRHVTTFNTINVTDPNLSGFLFNPTYNYTATQTYGIFESSNAFNLSPVFTQASALGVGTDTGWQVGLLVNPAFTWPTGRILSQAISQFTNGLLNGAGTITNLYGTFTWIGTTSGTVTTATGFYTEHFNGGTIGTFIGFQAAAGVGSAPTTRVAFYDSSTVGSSRFLAPISLGVNAAPTAQLDITSIATTRPSLRLIGIAAQSADYILIENSGGTDLFKIDSVGNIELRPDNFTATTFAQGTLVDFDATVTLNFASAGMAILDFGPTVAYDQTASTTDAFYGLRLNPTLKNVASEANSLGTTYGVDSSFTFNNDNATISNTNHIGFRSRLTTTITGGNLALYSSSIDFLADTHTYAALAGSLLRVGLQVNDKTGSGGLTSQYGILINDLTGATTNVAIRVLGTAASRHVPDFNFGTDATPTAYVQLSPAARSSVTTEKSQFLGSAQTITINSGATLADQRQYFFTAPVINGVAGGGTETVTNASTVYISGAPAGSNITFTNGPYSLFVDDGHVRLDSVLEIRGRLELASKTTVSLTADNQVVTTTNVSYISLSSDNGTAGNRTFVLTQSTRAGHVLVLEWTGTNAGELVDDSAQNGAGTHRLTATWTPTQYDTLTLMSDGTDWKEIARSTN